MENENFKVDGNDFSNEKAVTIKSEQDFANNEQPNFKNEKDINLTV